MYIPPGLMTHLNAEALECGRPGEDDPTAPTLPQYQPSQMNKPFVLDGARQQPRRQCRGGAWPKRTQPQPILQLSGMAPAGESHLEIPRSSTWCLRDSGAIDSRSGMP